MDYSDALVILYIIIVGDLVACMCKNQTTNDFVEHSPH